MEEPSSLYHYTSVDVLCKLFTQTNGEDMIFYASSVNAMNDSAEYAMALNKCEDSVDELLMEQALGIPFAICFSEKGDNIPMWNMYAKEGKGVCLKFNFDMLKAHFTSLGKVDCREMRFSKCSYQSISKISDSEKPLSANKSSIDTEKLRMEMTDAAFVKPECFKHEKEWRFMIWQDWLPTKSHKISFREKQDELCPYLEIPIPKKCMEVVILGPNATEQMIDATKLLVANHQGSYEKTIIRLFAIYCIYCID